MRSQHSRAGRARLETDAETRDLFESPSKKTRVRRVLWLFRTTVDRPDRPFAKAERGTRERETHTARAYPSRPRLVPSSAERAAQSLGRRRYQAGEHPGLGRDRRRRPRATGQSVRLWPLRTRLRRFFLPRPWFFTHTLVVTRRSLSREERRACLEARTRQSLHANRVASSKSARGRHQIVPRTYLVRRTFVVRRTLYVVVERGFRFTSGPFATGRRFVELLRLRWCARAASCVLSDHTAAAAVALPIKRAREIRERALSLSLSLSLSLLGLRKARAALTGVSCSSLAPTRVSRRTRFAWFFRARDPDLRPAGRVRPLLECFRCTLRERGL